ncbi:MAG: hypothetical protein MJZ72_00470 [Bacteroidales bacterium]|nr:hypothetical protein [Bacteroidales bacterium]
MKNKITLLIISLMMIIGIADAQRFTVFSDNPSYTVEEVKTYLSNVPKERQKEADALLAQFTEFWNSPWMDEEAQETFIDVANRMLKKRMRPFPHFQAYVDAYAAFVSSPFSGELDTWSKIVQYHINDESTLFKEKMQIYANIFTNNILYNSANSRWTAYGEIEAIGFDKEPYIRFADIDLVGSSAHDSLTVSSAQGDFFPSSLLFKGKKGEVYWDRAGLGAEVNAKIVNYTIDVRFPKFTAEDATLSYPQYFSKPLKGILEEKAGLATSEEKATYPRFRSSDDRISIKDIYKNVDYVGGFELRGSSIQGYSTAENLSEIYIKKDGKNIVKVYSRNFLFKPDNVLAEDASIRIMIDNDSIYHPAANFKYNETTKELLISRPKQGVGRTPFFDSYHKMDITAESISWKTDEERIEIKPIVGMTSESPAYFESQNFFDPSVMRKIWGYNEVNPLYKLWELFRSNGYEPLHQHEVIAWFNKSKTDITAMLVDFAARGFIEYDITNDKIIYRKKISQYLNNDVKQKDYDNIILESKTHYASYDLVSKDLRVTGCEFFVLSDAQIVNVYPADEKVTVKKNRDMVFSGRIVAGLFDFVSHNCEFNYDKFQVEMNVIDSMIMFVPDEHGPVNIYGEHKLRKIESPIEELAGTLFIDVPGNKSGTVDYPDYPIFEARKGGKVFYDKKKVLGGVYTRDRFYYLVDLFRIKNLDNFEIDSMKFTGALVSGGIFPDIREPLQARPDFSLGFIHHTPQSGLPCYEGRGGYTGIVDLSNRGLRGYEGVINYITSTTTSDSIVFFLDSCNASVTKHIVAEQEGGTEFPPAVVENAYMHWTPYQDKFYVYTLGSPMSIFRETELTGNSMLTPSGMFGTGTIRFKGAEIDSRLFAFKHHELQADTSDLKLYNLNTGELAFRTDNYNSHVDFKTRKGSFVSNGNASEVVFVKNEIRTNASAFDWEPIDETILRFRWDDPYKNVDIDNTPTRELIDMPGIPANELISTDPTIGLHFNALSAEFNYTTNIIKCEGIRFIESGDAAIFPHEGKATIYEKSRLDIFHNARLLVNRTEKYHELHDCTIRLNTSIRYYGSGFYDYIDENKTIQTLHFDTLWCINKTEGHAKIPLEKDFKLSPHFAFDGRAELHGDDQFLSFFGGVEIIHDCEEVKPARMKILQQVDPNHILLEVHERTKDVNDRKVVIAIASANNGGRIYTAFGRAKEQFNDAEYINTWGFITFNHATNEFWAASKEKLEDPTLPGNMLILSKEDCICRGNGKIDMGAKLGRIDFVTNGEIINFMKADSAQMHLTTSIDFFFNEESMKIMNRHIDNSDHLDFLDVSEDEDYEMSIKNLLTEDEYEKYAHDLAMGTQTRRLPQPLQVRFLFSRLDFEWDPVNSVFLSQRMLPLIICNSKQVYKNVPGRVVIEKRGSRNKLYIYFEFDNEFFFFQFENNSLYGYSSVKKFNEEIMNVKAKNKTLHAEKGKPSFTYKIGNRNQQRKFTKKFFPPLEEENTEE